MAKRTTSPLAYSEYLTLDLDGNPNLFYARQELMRSVQRVYPQMLENLSKAVFPDYVALAKSGFNFDSILGNPRTSPVSKIPQGQLKSALLQWAQEFHVDQVWLLDDALRTLRGWYKAPESRNSHSWNPIGTLTKVLVTAEPFCFRCEGWEMQSFTWADYCRSVRQRFEQKLREYESESRRVAESRGLVRAPRKYSPANFEWFVQYQFAGLSSKEIADQITSDNPCDESTVLKGVKAAAKLLGWSSPLRQAKKSSRKIR